VNSFRAHARVEASHACAELFRRTFFEKVWTDVVGTDENLYSIKYNFTLPKRRPLRWL
jgi:hypothetical protein